MLTPHVIRLIFDSAHIQRWNEFIRPNVGFTELDKQAHKAIIMYVLAKAEEEQGREINYRLLIDGFMSSFLHRTLLTDIKPPIYRRLYASHADKIYTWAYEQLSQKLHDEQLLQRIQEADKLSSSSYESRILKAAHYLASRWEFGIIESMNSKVYGIDSTKKMIESELEEHYTLLGVQKIALKQKSYDFIDLLGRLRFQKRWATTPRTPETSVMGHMGVVAIMAYLASSHGNICQQRAINNFFTGLFHDIPEVLTRDIISPVKYSIEGLDTLVKSIEEQLLEEELFPLASYSWRNELRYFIVNEFDNKICCDGKLKSVEAHELHEKYNHEMFNPIDGNLVGICDKFAAFVEASLSLEHGTVSNHLVQAVESMYQKNKSLSLYNIAFGKLYESFYLSVKSNKNE